MVKFDNLPLVILVGFSTAGKSHYLKSVKASFPNDFAFYDSDQFVAELFNGHIYNIFMTLGREEAIKFIENKEREFIKFLHTQTERPTLVAAGPFLVIRSGWREFVERRKPFIIHLEKSPEAIYGKLLDRKIKQKEELDMSNPNFGSWDESVMTQLENGVYVDIPSNLALSYIRVHLDRITPIYEGCRSHFANSDMLEKNSKKSQELVDLIIDKLKQGSQA